MVSLAKQMAPFRSFLSLDSSLSVHLCFARPLCIDDQRLKVPSEIHRSHLIELEGGIYWNIPEAQLDHCRLVTEVSYSLNHSVVCGLPWSPSGGALRCGRLYKKNSRHSRN